MSEITLRPCPFCGSSLIRLLPQEHGFSIDCTVCGAMKRVHSKRKVQIEAEWNQRRPPTPVTSSETQLKNLFDKRNAELVAELTEEEEEEEEEDDQE